MQAIDTISTDSDFFAKADTVAITLFEDTPPLNQTEFSDLEPLLASGEASGKSEQITHYHQQHRRVIVVGLGKKTDFDLEKARRTGAIVYEYSKQLKSNSLAWELSEGLSTEEAVQAVIEGAFLASYSFDRFKTSKDEESGPQGPKTLVLSSKFNQALGSSIDGTLATAQNYARDLQNTPANHLTPRALGEAAEQLASDLPSLSVDLKNLDGLREAGMGAFAAVAQGSTEEPRLITIHYEGPGAGDKTLGLVGKAVTFDTGGISIKPSPKMQEMKFDMSGGAAVLGAVKAIAELELPIKLVAVIGATENMPDGSAVKPGDIVTALNGTTIEVNNTDAEGRLVLADCLTHAVNEGADYLVDVATLTGAILISLGSTFAGLMSNDDQWAELLEASGKNTGELLWRLPLHAEYAKAMKGQYADLHNVNEDRKAGSITAAEFLKHFVSDKPWAHLDIAGTAWDLGRPYCQKGGSGFGVRLLTDAAQNFSRL